MSNDPVLLLHGQPGAAADWERLRAALYPDGVPQERVFGWPTLAARIGAGEFKRLVFDRLAEVGPFATALQELRP